VPGADHPAGLGVAFAEGEVEVGGEAGADGGQRGGLALHGEGAALRAHGVDHGAAPRHLDHRLVGRVVGAGHAADLLEGEGVAGDVDTLAGAQRLDALLLEGGGGDAGHQHGEAEMGQRHAVGGARQAHGAAPGVAQGQAQEADALGPFGQHARGAAQAKAIHRRCIAAARSPRFQASSGPMAMATSSGVISGRKVRL